MPLHDGRSSYVLPLRGGATYDTDSLLLSGDGDQKMSMVDSEIGVESSYGGVRYSTLNEKGNVGISTEDIADVRPDLVEEMDYDKMRDTLQRWREAMAQKEAGERDCQCGFCSCLSLTCARVGAWLLRLGRGFAHGSFAAELGDCTWLLHVACMGARL
jgi:hypothetical protein